MARPIGSRIPCKETVRYLERPKVLRKLPGLCRVLISRMELDRYPSIGNQTDLSGGFQLKLNRNCRRLVKNPIG